MNLFTDPLRLFLDLPLNLLNAMMTYIFVLSYQNDFGINSVGLTGCRPDHNQGNCILQRAPSALIFRLPDTLLPWAIHILGEFWGLSSGFVPPLSLKRAAIQSF